MSSADMFDIDEEEVEAINKMVADNPRRNDRRICICGHSFSRHAEGTDECKPVSFKCACMRKHPVLEVKNTKYFIARSVGSGEGHALVRGYMASKKAIPTFEADVKLLVELKCELPGCGKPTKLYPTRTDHNGFRLYDHDKDLGWNVLLCEECRSVYADSDAATGAARSKIKVVPNKDISS